MNTRSLRPAPVEPLSPQAWQRVEAAVFSRLDDGIVLPMPYMPHESYTALRARRPLRWHWALSMGLSVAAAAAASVVHVSRSTQPSEVTGVAPALPGVVASNLASPRAAASAPEPALPTATPPRASAASAAPPSAEASPVLAAAAPATPAATSAIPAAAAPPHDGLHVATGRERRSLAVGDSRFELSQHTEMLARGNDAEGWQVELAHGRVEFDVAPRRERPPFVIHSGEVEVRVIGTRFSVRHESQSTEVRVQRGIVEVERSGQVVRLSPGDLWLDGVVAGGLRDPRRSAASAHPHGTRPERIARSERELRFERAAGLESENAPEALELYLALAQGDDAWASNALYAAARLELDQGDREAGDRLLGEYLERFPGGENEVDVGALRARLGGTEPP